MADIKEKLDRALLERTVPPCNVRAGSQLKQAGIAYSQIVGVRPEAILYLNEHRRAWTAWTELRDNTLVLYRQEGFPAMPSPYLEDHGK